MARQKRAGALGRTPAESHGYRTALGSAVRQEIPGAADFQVNGCTAESKYILRIFILIDNYMPFSDGASS